MNSLAGRDTGGLTKCQGVQTSSQSSIPPTHSTVTQSLPCTSERFQKLLCFRCLRVLNVFSPQLFSLHTDLSASLVAFLIMANTDDALPVLPVLPSRGCLCLSTHISSPYGYLSLDEELSPPAQPFNARGACHPRIVEAVAS